MVTPVLLKNLNTPQIIARLFFFFHFNTRFVMRGAVSDIIDVAKTNTEQFWELEVKMLTQAEED